MSNVNPRARVLWLALATAGCSLSPQQPEIHEIAPMMEVALERGRFELDCPDTDARALGLMHAWGGYTLQRFGVAGCGRRVVYHVECHTRCAAFRDAGVAGIHQEGSW